MTHPSRRVIAAAALGILLVAAMTVLAGLHHAATRLTAGPILGCLALLTWALLPPADPDRGGPALRAAFFLLCIVAIAAFDALAWARLANVVSVAGEDRGRVVVVGLIMVALGNQCGKFRVPPEGSLITTYAPDDRSRRRQGLWVMACGAAGVIGALAFGLRNILDLYNVMVIGWIAIRYANPTRLVPRSHRRS